MHTLQRDPAELRTGRMSKTGPDLEPTVVTRGSNLDLSIIVATRDRAACLARTLRALAPQNLTGLSWQVVVVDNGSSDATADVLLEAAKTLPLVTLVEPSPGKNKALNRAITVARGQLFIFTDDDVIPAPDWAATLYKASKRWPQDNIFGGAIKPRFPQSTPLWLTSVDFPYGRWAFGQYAPRVNEGPTSDTPLGANLAIRRRVFFKTGFDDSMGPRGRDYPMGSEVDLLLRLYRHGEQFIFVPSAVVEHVLQEHAITRTHLNGRAYRCGRGNARLRPDAGSFPLFGIPLYIVKRAVAALAGAAVSPLRRQSDRWIALLTLHQVRGNITERRRMLASRGAAAHRFPGLDAFKLLIESRGLFGAVLTPIRWAFNPFIRCDVYQFFEQNLGQQKPDLPRENDFSVRIFRGAEHSRTVRVALCPLESMKPEKIDRRLERGDSVAIAWVDGRAVAYAWSAYSDLAIPEVRSTFRVGSSDIMGYDGYVIPDRRGQGFLPHLDTALMEAAVKCNRKRQIICTNTRNRSTTRSMKRIGKRKLFKVAYVRIPLAGWEMKLALGAPFYKYFRRPSPQLELRLVSARGYR
jgi:glycosyltransferase involved in cell wall biosynthesis/GNAT superfamily N-acetyltransferase